MHVGSAEKDWYIITAWPVRHGRSRAVGYDSLAWRANDL